MIIRSSNLFEAWIKLNEFLVGCDNSTYLDWNPQRQEYYLHIPEVLIRSKNSTVPSLYLEDLFYSSRGSKMNNLLSKYLDPSQTRWWLNEIVKWDRIDSPIFLPTKSPSLHKGNCIIGFSFRTSPSLNLTVLYRALEMPAKAGADFFLTAAIAQEILIRVQKPRIPVVIFADACWITTRTARIYLMYKSPKKVKYRNFTFNKVVQEGWRDYFLGDKNFLSTSGKRMQKAYKSLVEGQPKRIDQKLFHQKFKHFLEEV